MSSSEEDFPAGYSTQAPTAHTPGVGGVALTGTTPALEEHLAAGHISPDDFEDEAMEALLAQPETTQKELWGWYMYDWANSVYFNTVLSALLPPFLLLKAKNQEGADHKINFLFGIRLSGDSYYSTVIPFAVVLQLILFISLGTVGDFGHMRKKVLVATSLIGSISTILMGLVTDSTYWFGGLLLVISNLGMGMSIIVYNAFMPALVANMPEVRKARGTDDYDTVESEMSNRVSTRGFALGYLAGVLCLVINLGIAVAMGDACNQWCADCPTPTGNVTTPGWNAYDYQIFNQTMLNQTDAICNNKNKLCLAWPGINPPCSNVNDVTSACMDKYRKYYRYTASGPRWSFFLDLDPATADRLAWNNTQLCVAEHEITLDLLNLNTTLGQANAQFAAVATLRPGPEELLTNNTAEMYAALGLPLALFDPTATAVDGTDPTDPQGCPHFRCHQTGCSRGFDPTTCDGHALGFRLNIALAGLWWLGFSMFTFFWLKPRPAPPLPAGKNYFTESVKRVYTTFKSIRKLKNTFLFLLSYWLFSDGIATVGFAATLIAAQSPLFFGPALLAGLLLLTNFSALCGNFFYEWMARQLVARWKKKQLAAGLDEDQLDAYWVNRLVIFINLFFISFMPIWGMPGVGLTVPYELFIAGAIYAFQLGSIQAFSRSLLQHFTPVGAESEFFAFFELTDKGTSWLGPIVLTVVKEATGQMRWGLGAILFFFIGGAIIMFFVDTKKGGLEAENFHVAAEVQIDELVAANPSLRVDNEALDNAALERKISRKRTLTGGRSQPGLLANAQTEE